MSQGRGEDDAVLVLLPLPVDPLFIDAVDEAVAGDVAEMPAAQPDRPIGGKSTDFASLYIRHRASFALHARRFLNDPRDVDEVLQEAFLRLFLAMPELENELQALTYCRRTVTNLCIDRYRADQRRPRLVDLEAVDWDPSSAESYDDPVLRAEDAAIVREALALLSPLHREALIKREIEEKPLPQIAAELDIPEESVKHLLYRARRSLRRLLVGTSVEPGVDLSATQALRLANERLARATLRSANVLIVLFVAAVTVVGALRVGLQDQQLRSDGLGSESSPELGPGGNPGVSPMLAPRKHPASTRIRHHSPTAVSAPVATRVAPLVATAPKRDAWHATRAVPVRHVASTEHRYSLRGSLRPTGPVRVQSSPAVIDAAGGAVATSVLSAPTTAGAFSLTQTIAQASDGSTSVQIQPQLVKAGAVVTTGVVSSAAVTRDPSGTLSVDIAAKNIMPTTSSPVGDLNVHLVLGGDLTTVLSEDVVVGAPAPASSVAPVVTSPTTTTQPTSVTTPTTPTTCSSSSITQSSSTVTTANATDPVIGMSTEWQDDQLASCTSNTDGGSVPLLPSPAQP